MRVKFKDGVVLAGTARPWSGRATKLPPDESGSRTPFYGVAAS